MKIIGTAGKSRACTLVRRAGIHRSLVDVKTPLKKLVERTLTS